MRKKDLLSILLQLSGCNSLSRVIQGGQSGNSYLILTYHRVLDTDDRYEFDENLISANTRQFESQVRFLREHYNLISFRELLTHIDQQENLPGNSVIITFDDGFLDNYVNAYPILKKYAAPATFFLSVDYIGKEVYYWFDEMIFILKKIDMKALLELMNHFGIMPELTTGTGKPQLLRQCMRFVKRAPNAIRLEFLERLRQLERPPAAGYSVNTGYLNTPMTWEQVREISANGIEIGSHTMTHPILSNLTDDELQIELQQSHAILSTSNVNYTPVLVYPVGGDYAFNDKVKASAAKIGYRLACSYLPGINNYSTQDNYAVKRLSVESYMRNHYMSSMLSYPKLFLR